jgi:hypothetical protein
VEAVLSRPYAFAIFWHCSKVPCVRNWAGRWAFQIGPSDGPPSYLVKTAALRIYGPIGIRKEHQTEIRIWTRLLPSVCSSPELCSCSLPPIPCYTQSRFHLILQILYPVTLITVIGSQGLLQLVIRAFDLEPQNFPKFFPQIDCARWLPWEVFFVSPWTTHLGPCQMGRQNPHRLGLVWMHMYSSQSTCVEVNWIGIKLSSTPIHVDRSEYTCIQTRH